MIEVGTLSFDNPGMRRKPLCSHGYRVILAITLTAMLVREGVFVLQPTIDKTCLRIAQNLNQEI